MATLAYASHHHTGNSPQWLYPWWFGTPAVSDNLKTELTRIAERWTPPAGLGFVPAETGIEPTPPVTTAIRSHLQRHGEAICQEIKRCFGVDAAGLVRQGATRAQIRLRHAVEGVSTPAEHELTFDGERTWRLTIPEPRSGGIGFGLGRTSNVVRERAGRLGGDRTWRLTIPDGFRIRRRDHDHDRFAKLSFKDQHADSNAWMAVGLLAEALMPSPRRTFYLPADRTGLMNAHSTVVSALIQSATMAGILGAPAVPPLSGVRGDFLKQLVEMTSALRLGRQGHESLDAVGKHIEGEMLGGAVEVGGLPGVAQPRFIYRPSGWRAELPLTNAASMVSELAPVVLYLRHVVAPGDLLIIDEPESHLHPAMQVAFTRQIAEIVRAGVRIIVTTHSEWVLEELGNVVGRGRRADGEEKAGALNPRDVGVWLFEPTEDGATAREIALDAESGLYPSGFEAVATALHNDWANIVDPYGGAA